MYHKPIRRLKFGGSIQIVIGTRGRTHVRARARESGGCAYYPANITVQIAVVMRKAYLLPRTAHLHNKFQNRDEIVCLNCGSLFKYDAVFDLWKN